MKISVRLFAGAREAVGAGTVTLEIPVGATAGDALRELVSQHPSLQRLAAVSRLAIDGVYASADAPLNEGTELAILPPVSGG